MGAIEQIAQMKSQGMTEGEIIGELQQQGMAPKQISDAFSHHQIKNAVASENQFDEMQPSIMEQAPQQNSQMPYSPKTQEIDESQTMYESPQTTDQYQQYGQEQYPQEYSQEGYSNYAGATDTDTMIEVANQVFLEKIGKIQKKLDDLTQFKTISETKIEYISERLKKIEGTIDKLQIAILDKVGSYGGTLESIKKEMGMMQDSFRKVITKPHTERHSSTSKTTRKKSSKRK